MSTPTTSPKAKGIIVPLLVTILAVAAFVLIQDSKHGGRFLKSLTAKFDLGPTRGVFVGSSAGIEVTVRLDGERGSVASLPITCKDMRVTQRGNSIRMADGSCYDFEGKPFPEDVLRMYGGSTDVLTIADDGLSLIMRSDDGGETRLIKQP